MGVEYVYALHDFQPENEDEVEFKAGERIEVVERDDLYQDGWWQGKNLAGKTGLFPVSYTQPAPRAQSPPPASPRVADISASVSAPATVSTHPNVPSPPPQTQPLPSILTTSPSDAEPDASTSSLLPLIEESEPAVSTGGKVTPNGEVMRATMTDVQQALEQLGRHADGDGARSFTFASTRDGESTDHDSLSERENNEEEEEGEDWYRSTRARLAERARQQVAEARAEEAARNPVPAPLPPIDVDISDESGDEDEDVTSHRRAHPRISEEDEGEGSPLVEASDEFIVPSPLPTATQDSFPLPPTTIAPSPAENAVRAVSPPPPVAAPEDISLPRSPAPQELITPIPSQIDDQPTPTPQTHEIPPSLPSPLPTGSNGSSTRFGTPPTSHVAESSTLSPTGSSMLSPGGGSSVRKSSLAPRGHPSDWSVEEVVDWLRSKGFDEGVCDKFIEQEITGDVLLDLDVNLLKAEIGIVAFGKRMRIANAISDLRRPPSVISDRGGPGSSTFNSITTPSSQFGGINGNGQFASPTSTNNQYGTPGTFSTPQSHSGPGSITGSAGSPFILGHGKSQSVATATTHLSSPSPYTPASLQPAFTEEPNEESRSEGGAGSESQATLGLGLGVGSAVPGSLMPGGRPNNKGRPSQLTLSPSDSQLGANVKAIAGDVPESDERGVMSESETTATKRRRSTKSSKNPPPSASAASTHSKEGSATDSPKSHARKRSVDASKPAGDRDRHSLFGGAFSGSLGKSRKPAPRYSATEAEPTPEKSGLSFPRLLPGAGRKSSGRPGTSDGVPTSSTLVAKDNGTLKRDRDARRDSVNSGGSKDKDKEKRDPALLRKRTSSAGPGNGTRTPGLSPVDAKDKGMIGGVGGGDKLKAGQSILQQIGAPDYNGWMRKKGEHYNVWKSRYFVLKGPHLYWLRSNSPAELKIKGYVNTTGYRIVADEKIDPGKYGFKLVHDHEKAHYFSSEEQSVIREWMKALMKSSIDRDYSKPVVSSVNIPTIPLQVAQAMNPAPRPPSPTQRAATQKALRRENTNQLSTRDAQILMGVGNQGERARLDSVFSTQDAGTPSSLPMESAASAPQLAPVRPAPPSRPSRELRRATSVSTQKTSQSADNALDPALVEWANSHVPAALHIPDNGSGPLTIGLTLLRLAESIKGSPASPPVPDAAFPTGPEDADKLEGLFRLFDFLLDNDVRMGSVSINDVRQGRRDKVVQLLKALRAWEEKRRNVARSIGKGGVGVGGFVAPVGPWEA
ncbi:hypothetical protein PENSPDRAFT_654221 [Peniophora sp. CONT]|nr:hypothetical protein PENSPDRAFT_654221 [Peniophora sp. CONT]